MKKLFDKYEQWVPVAAWVSITMATVYIKIIDQSESRLLELLSQWLGVGLFWIPRQITRGLKENWSNISIGCLWGLIPYLLVNTYFLVKYYNTTELPEHVTPIYIGVIQSVALMGTACFAMIWLLKFRHRD